MLTEINPSNPKFYFPYLFTCFDRHLSLVSVSKFPETADILGMGELSSCGGEGGTLESK